MDEITAKRLAFIKYVWRRADEVAQEPEPLSAAAVLSFHDAVELFLQLASEHVDSGSSSPGFMDYWELLGAKVPGGLGRKEAMRRLNKARVALKHHGTMPSALDIQSFRSSTRDFFEDNTPRVFGVTFEAVSLSAFVSPPETRAALDQAVSHLEQNDVEHSLEASATAFFHLLSHADKVVANRHGISPFESRQGIDRYARSFFSFGDLDNRDRDLARFAQAVAAAIEEIRDALRLIALRVDYHRYLRFKQATPNVMQTGDGKLHLSWFRTAVGSPELTAPLARFCIDFVLDASLSFSGTAHIHGLFMGATLR